MGYNIEYLVAVPKQAVRGWLESLSGFFMPEPGDVELDWEGQLEAEGTFWAHVQPKATHFVLAAKYSWLFSEHPPTVDFARRFERAFWKGVGEFPLIRLDEWLRADWEQNMQHEWWQVERPVETLLQWLADNETTHWIVRTPSVGDLAAGSPRRRNGPARRDANR
jgi:hypothetical protein